MAKPNKNDYASWESILKKVSKGLLEDGSPKRKIDENKAKQLFREAVRKRWMSCNPKLHFLESKREPDEDPTTRRKWQYRCNKCKDYFKKDHVDVDHKKGQKSFTEWDQAFEHAASILDVGSKDLQLLCNIDTDSNCHATKTTCERLGLDWESEEGWAKGLFERRLNKLLDTTCKKAAGQKKFIKDNGLEPESNEPKRKIQIRQILEQQEGN